MKTRLLHAAVALTAAVGLAGCDSLGLACTEIGWYEGATLHIVMPRPAVQDGQRSYRVEIEAEGETLALGVLGAAASYSCLDACTSQGQHISVQVIAGDTASIDVAVGHANHESGPALIRVRVHDGDITRSAEVKPQYKTTEPNGDGCGEAHTAEVDVTPS